MPPGVPSPRVESWAGSALEVGIELRTIRPILMANTNTLILFICFSFFVYSDGLPLVPIENQSALPE